MGNSLPSKQPGFQPDRSDIVRNCPLFDAGWYRSTYRDVALSELPPWSHFQLYGQWIERGISASHRNASSFPELTTALRRMPDISYCIPIMNRPDDIRTTLGANLDENRSLSEHLEFVVLFFDEDVQTREWIKASFPGDLASGYLRVIVSDELKTWHFCRAKNAFKGRISGKVYSSLDGDNFVTRQETEQLLQLANRHVDGFVFHHFSGNWGDGSSGRVSVSRKLYERGGYDESMLPRQYDEIDMIVTTLVRHPLTTLVRYDCPNNLFSTKLSSAFAQAKNLPRKLEILGEVERRAPMNPRGESYVESNLEFKAMQDFNQRYCFWKNADAGPSRGDYLQQVYKERHKLIDYLPAEKLIPMIVAKADGGPLPVVQPGQVSLLCCVKNDDLFLREFYRHYLEIGVDHFFIIDDGSEVPVQEKLRHANVHVFKPQVGGFAVAKGLWMEALIKRFVPEGSWALTVDADEFLDIRPYASSLAELTADAERGGAEFIPALLLDMLPDDGQAEQAEGVEVEHFTSQFPDHALVPADRISSEYLRHSAIRWGFGEFSTTSWKFDARFHAYGTFDSLRKLSLFRYRPHLHLNQGFHELHFTDKSPTAGTRIWKREVILPLRHYKIAKLFSDRLRKDAAQLAGSAVDTQYHPRTAENIARIFSGGSADAMQTLLALPRVRYSPESFRIYVHDNDHASAADL